MRAATGTVDGPTKGRRTMSTWLSEREQRLVAGAEAASAPTPTATQNFPTASIYRPAERYAKEGRGTD